MALTWILVWSFIVITEVLSNQFWGNNTLILSPLIYNDIARDWKASLHAWQTCKRGAVSSEEKLLPCVPLVKGNTSQRLFDWIDLHRRVCFGWPQQGVDVLFLLVGWSVSGVQTDSTHLVLILLDCWALHTSVVLLKSGLNCPPATGLESGRVIKCD